MFYIVLLQAAVSIMRKVDRPPTNPKRLIIESSQECFSVDIPRSTDMGDPTNVDAADAKKIPMPNVDGDDDFERWTISDVLYQKDYSYGKMYEDLVKKYKNSAEIQFNH